MKNRGIGYFLVLLAVFMLHPVVIAANEVRNAHVVEGNANKATQQGRRVALLIGNFTYSKLSSLVNPKHDVALMEATLRELGFDEIIGGTQRGMNLNSGDMHELLHEFGEKSSGAEVAVIFFAGHGLMSKIGSEQYLAATNTTAIEGRLEAEALSITAIMKKLSTHGAKKNFVFLDACRTAARSIGMRSITPSQDAPNTVILYATAANDFAEDGEGKNSPFTQALAAEIKQPNEWAVVQRNVIKRVLAETQERQEPKQYGGLRDEMYFNIIANPSVVSAEIKFWEGIKNSDNPADFEGYQNKYPKGEFFSLAENKLKRFSIAQENALVQAMNAFSRWHFSSMPYSPLSRSQQELNQLAQDGNIFAPFMIYVGYSHGREVMAMNWRKHADAVRPILKNMADRGSVIAMTSLSLDYLSESDNPKDKKQAIEWLEKAAARGYVKAMVYLVLFKNEATGVELLRKAAAMGDATGMYVLGALYANGRFNISKNKAKAVEWFRKAAEAGYGDGMFALGVMYGNGEGGLPKDEYKAIEWICKAAEVGYIGGMRDLAPSAHIESMEFWSELKKENNIVSYEGYKKRCPKGRFVKLAENEILKLKGMPVPIITIPSAGIIDGRYELLNKGTEVKDLQTGLIWQRCEVGFIWNKNICEGKTKKFTFNEAKKQIGNGWRIPTISELTSILTKESVGEYYLNQKVFPSNYHNDDDALYETTTWSSSRIFGDSDLAWSINFINGYSLYWDEESIVRLVRDGK
jgi:hypothetical protein